MLKKVYICAPLTDQPTIDLAQAKRYAGYALKCGTAPVVPHFYAECISGTRKQLRELIRATALSLIWVCDEVWVFGDQLTDGMSAEIRHAKLLNINIRTFSDKEIRKLTGG